MIGFRLPADRPYFIAEIGPNHNRRIDTALQMIDLVAAAGADAVKFQTFESARTVVAAGAPLAEYMKRSSWAGDQETLLEAIRLTFDDFRTIAAACKGRGITFLSTPFDIPSVRFLASLDVPLLKLPSGEITNAFLLREAAKTGLPLIVSTGMAGLEDVRQALRVIREVWVALGKVPGPDDLILLHCTSAYPAPASAANLAAMQTLAEAFSVPVGYSDHTLGAAVPIAATAMGARVIEKHVTLDVGMDGPDHAASFPLARLGELVASLKDAASAIGDGKKEMVAEEADVRRVARRSLAAAENIQAGQKFSLDLLTALRPGIGISPMDAEMLVGRSARRAYKSGEIIIDDELS